MEITDGNFNRPAPIRVAPGIFRRGADSSDRGANIRFSGTINAKNLQKYGVSPSDGGLACSDGATAS